VSQSDSIVFGAGCFWCIEAVFEEVRGVKEVLPGYTGGQRKNPTYEQVCTGATGHVEVVKVVYDPELIDLTELFAVFFSTHDPTTLNRQGNDVGTHYRSVIFTSGSVQATLARFAVVSATSSGAWKEPVVTSVEPLKEFYRAEHYHHGYYSTNSESAYCMAVITPKLDKFKSEFSRLIK
jgi:peptide-methionine (S)-S-oxide reductase|tara:strand:- start:710 stop:1246 length:537 start_codon:yes stop_codon:yes gene_type:complete